MSASVLALLGVEVSIACYSDYLSKRDFAEFKDMFSTLKILPKIHYGTFNQVCESIINSGGDLRERVANFVLGKGSSTKGNQASAKVLLVDEVDVFFNKEFYGNVYNPSSIVKDPTITKLIMYMWENRFVA